MTENPYTRLKFLQEFLQNTYQTFNEDAIADLGRQDYVYFDQIRSAESEIASLRAFIANEERKEEQKILAQQQGQPAQQQLNLNNSLSAAMPPAPQQTRMQILNSTTMFTPLPSIVEVGYDKPHKGINWTHYQNMLKLYTLGVLIKETPTQQQQKDIDDLSKAIETVGNAKYKKKHLTAEQIVDNSTGAYMRFGKNVIRALANPNPETSEFHMNDLYGEIADTRSDDNADQLRKMMHKAKTVFTEIKARYRGRE